MIIGEEEVKSNTVKLRDVNTRNEVRIFLIFASPVKSNKCVN